MNIGIDARMFGPATGGGGLGRYVEQLVTGLEASDVENRYVLFLKPENAGACWVTNPRFEKRVVPIHWYTAEELFFLGPKMDKERLDFIHFPHWNVPVRLKTPFIVTIHDLIMLEEPRSSKASTRHPLVYLLKYAAYRRVLANSISRAEKIIAVSEYTKQSILKFFPKTPAEKICVIYEGVAPLDAGGFSSLTLPTPFLLYVGNAYPHKNLPFLIRAFQKLASERPELSLVLAGRNDFFFQRLQKETPPDGRIRFVHNPSDVDLATLYQNASAFVFPSKTEGFGLPPLEAMAFNLPVVCSNGGSLPEIIGPAALFFDPTDEAGLISQIKIGLEDQQIRERLVKEGQERQARYSWKTMVQEIKRLYIWRNNV